MRITGGALRGRRLTVPKDRAIRPTSDKVREALFDILGQQITEARFLDCFAGVGAIGLDALSHGAESAVLIEMENSAIALIEKNARTLGLEPEIHKGDFFMLATRLARAGRQFDLIFVDPPYADEIQVAAVETIGRLDLLAKRGTVIVEHDRRNPLPTTISDLHCDKTKSYGETGLAFYHFPERDL